MQIDERGLYGQYGIWHQPFWQQKWFVYGVYSVLFLLISIVCIKIFYWYRGRVRKKNIPYWQKALQQLYALKNKEITQEQSVEFYTKITSIYKEYMSIHYAVDLSCKTDEEFIFACQMLPMSVEQKEEIRTFFLESVEIRFAHKNVSCDGMKRDLSNCISYIIQTRPHEKQSRSH